MSEKNKKSIICLCGHGWTQHGGFSGKACEHPDCNCSKYQEPDSMPKQDYIKIHNEIDLLRNKLTEIEIKLKEEITNYFKRQEIESYVELDIIDKKITILLESKYQEYSIVNFENLSWLSDFFKTQEIEIFHSESCTECCGSKYKSVTRIECNNINL